MMLEMEKTCNGKVNNVCGHFVRPGANCTENENDGISTLPVT